MEKFIEAAAIAWNPIGEARRRMRIGTLTVGSVLIPFIGIVIGCNLFAGGAQMFFYESMAHATGSQLPDLPLITNDYSQRFLSAIGVLVPVAAVSLLPSAVFSPPGRSATVAAMLVVAASWAFYGAATVVPIYFLSGALATVSPELSWNVINLFSIPAIITIIGLVLFFWFRISLSILELSVAQMICISLVALITLALVAGFFTFVISASFS